MLYLYFDPYDSRYILCNPDTFQVGLWDHNTDIVIASYFLYTSPDASHTVFSTNSYTLISTYNCDTLADFQSDYPELFI